MFGFITRTEHDRVVAERDDALHLIDKQARDLAQLRASHRLMSAACDAYRAKLAKFHTTRDGSGRFTKRAQEGADA